MSFLAREVGAVFVLLGCFLVVCFVVDRWWSNGEGRWKSTAHAANFMFRARGSIVGNIPIPGTVDSHTINLLFFVISLLMCGVLGGVFLSMGYTLATTAYRPLRLERHIVEWW